MLLAFAVFVVAIVAIVSGCFAAAQLPGVLAERRLNARLKDVALAPAGAEKETGEETVIKSSSAGPMPAMDRMMSGTTGGKRMNRLIEQAGMRTTASAVVLFSILSAASCGLVAFVLVPQRFAPLLAAAAGAIAPLGWLLHKRTKRLKRFEEQFPEALDLVSRAIRAGHAFQTALGMVADELPEPVGPEFKKTFEQQNFGLPLREALDEMAARIGSLDVRFFVTAVLIQRDTGGNLAEILENLAHVVRERFKIRRQVRVHTAHGRFTGWVLLALPAALALALSFINPEHMNVLFREPMGQTMLITAIIMQTVGFIWIRQVIKIEV